jgi:hypothetical protein
MGALVLKTWRLLLIVAILILAESGYSFSNHGFYGGLGFYSENSLGKQTRSENGSSSLMGVSTYPLLLKYDLQAGAAWFVSPTFTYTFLPRSSSGGSAKVTLIHLMFPFGTNLSWPGWDWSAGPGLLHHTLSGSGGTTQMNNGTGTATFAMPAQSVSVDIYTFNLGTSYQFGANRWGADLISEAVLSHKRTFSFMVSYAYMFSGGHF